MLACGGMDLVPPFHQTLQHLPTALHAGGGHADGLPTAPGSFAPSRAVAGIACGSWRNNLARSASRAACVAPLRAKAYDSWVPPRYGSLTVRAAYPTGGQRQCDTRCHPPSSASRGRLASDRTASSELPDTYPAMVSVANTNGTSRRRAAQCPGQYLRLRHLPTVCNSISRSYTCTLKSPCSVRWLP